MLAPTSTLYYDQAFEHKIAKLVCKDLHFLKVLFLRIFVNQIVFNCTISAFSEYCVLRSKHHSSLFTCEGQEVAAH